MTEVATNASAEVWAEVAAEGHRHLGHREAQVGREVQVDHEAKEDDEDSLQDNLRVAQRAMEVRAVQEVMNLVEISRVDDVDVHQDHCCQEAQVVQMESADSHQGHCCQEAQVVQVGRSNDACDQAFQCLTKLAWKDDKSQDEHAHSLEVGSEDCETHHSTVSEWLLARTNVPWAVLADEPECLHRRRRRTWQRRSKTERVRFRLPACWCCHHRWGRQEEKHSNRHLRTLVSDRVRRTCCWHLLAWDSVLQARSHDD